MSEPILIVDYTPEHRTRFREINEQWIVKSYFLEEEDIKTLNDPEEYILKNGGKIFIALYNGFPVGTCAYLHMGERVYEMIKMGVDEEYRGLRIGRMIGEVSLERMKDLGARSIFLYSNTKGSELAIQMYRKLGFEEIPLDNAEFQRADIKMELHFHP